MIVTMIVRVGNKLLGYGGSTKRTDKEKIQEELEKLYGKNNIVLLRFKE